ncbi:tyrosine-protein phosphatase [Loigolactobacillus zhaoyuanensis]|uniref:Tyrosine-protein phosphatase n=1 Tax=Loigolactobacillus zhaoyuanensis TaxID=2486017 RepID=A0ABW8UDK5_9LACO|nr:tyrosine-protein phosphatase [Loigolactobacillus zhaoyuanensis]
MSDTRILPLEHGYNFRELGGYQTEDGHQIKWHKLIRAAQLNDLSANDLNWLNNYGLRTIVDFRSPEEKLAAPDRIPQNGHYHFLPVFAVDETKNSIAPQALLEELRRDPDGHKQMLQAYQNLIIDTHAQQTYHQFFSYLLANSTDEHSLLFHCTAGKDRTGIGAALLLGALGIPLAQIKTDYLLTQQASTKQFALNMAQAKAYPGITPEQITGVHDLMSVYPEYLAMAWTTMEKIAGSLSGYLHEQLQLSDRDLQDLKRIYLD